MVIKKEDEMKPQAKMTNDSHMGLEGFLNLSVSAYETFESWSLVKNQRYRVA